MELKLISGAGQNKSESVSASDKLFGREYNESLVHQLLIAYMSNARGGNRAQKDRSEVNKSTHTSNATIRDFLKSPEFSEEEKFDEWFEKLKANTLQDDDSIIKVAYQTTESEYHGRSFEDAFMSVNKKLLLEHSDYLKKNGLDSEFEDELKASEDYYSITENILNKK